MIKFFFSKKVTNIIDQNYKALEGHLNINKLQKKVYLKYFFITKINTLYLYVNNIIRDYPRFLDRIELIEKLNMCKYKIIVAGKNWENYIDSKKKNIELLGEIDSNKVLDIYRQSKVTISSNCHGLGLHSRVLEAGISKSLVMMNKSDPNISGNMSCEFKPGIHFIEYSKESFSKKLQMILNDNKLREQITNNMFEEIKSKHLWSHRAKQLNSIIKNDFF